MGTGASVGIHRKKVRRAHPKRSLTPVLPFTEDDTSDSDSDDSPRRDAGGDGGAHGGGGGLLRFSIAASPQRAWARPSEVALAVKSRLLGMQHAQHATKSEDTARGLPLRLPTLESLESVELEVDEFQNV
ncbi:unnamed protein product [Durusdinium trenchii]|uniref:Uncharacterized protein n=1 Tax=Durusdinium trenchii TaxID=1381693 RepID=A0ABP0Q821_9DINO